MVDVEGQLAVGIVPVSETWTSSRGRSPGFKKAAMADPAAAERRTGYVLGGIFRLGQRQPSPTVLDDGSGAWNHTGFRWRRGLDIELALEIWSG